MRKLNVIGNRYGKLVVLSEHSKTRNGHIRYTCQCDCGNTSDVLLTHLRQKRTISCGCDAVKRGSRHKQWKGYGEISGNVFDQIKRSASGVKGNRKALPMTVTIEYLWGLFLGQDRKCALSGIELTFPVGKIKGTASLDRIDSSKGYVLGNVQWVHKDINLMKNRFSQQRFIELCKLVAGGACEINI